MHLTLSGLCTGDRIGYTLGMAKTPPFRGMSLYGGPPPLRPGTWCVFSGGQLPHPVAIRAARSPDGRLVCTGLALGGLDGDAAASEEPEPEITARDLRAIPLSQLLAGGGKELVGGLLGLTATDFSGLRARPGPTGHPREHFEGVAEAYRRALVESPRSPVKWVSQELHYSDATVRRWLRRCRDMGLLGESTPGRPGEHPPKKTTKSKKGKR